MDKNTFLIGTCKYYKMGSKGNRYKLTIDNPELAEWVNRKISDSVALYKLKGNPIIRPQDLIRNRQIEVRLI